MTTPKPELKAETGEPKAADKTRLPYEAPKLRPLGSVRELTLGHTTSGNEGGGTRFS